MVKLQQITHDVSRHYCGGLILSSNDPSTFRRRLEDWFHSLPFSNIILTA
jgi:hypothetical protein